MGDASFRRELGAAAPGRFGARKRGGRLGPSDLLDVGRGSDGGAARRLPEARLPSSPTIRHRDHLIFSKGHASPLYYAMLKAAGAINDEELLTFRALRQPPARVIRRRGSRPPTSPPARSVRGCRSPSGVALAGKRARPAPVPRLGRCAATRRWPRARSGRRSSTRRWAGLDNLTAIVDVNRLGQTRETMLGWDLDGYAGARRGRSAGTRSSIDGHDVEADRRSPTARRVADDRTAERHPRADQEGPGRRGGRGPARQARQAARRPGGRRSRSSAANATCTSKSRRRIARPSRIGSACPAASFRAGRSARRSPHARPTARRLRRSARSAAMSWRSTARSRTRRSPSCSRRRIPDRYFEMFIAEQQMIAAAVGMQVRGWVPFASTFAAFLAARTTSSGWRRSRAPTSASAARTRVSRSARTGLRRWRSRTSRRLRAVHGSTVLHPSDANQTAPLVAEMADRPGISYMRTLRPKTSVRTAPGRGHPDRRQPDAARRRRGRVHDRRLRDHRRRGRAGGRHARGRRDVTCA